jgi:hypothetical protein
VGRLLTSTTGVDEGAGVGATTPLVELQAVIMNNPNKPNNINVNIFFMALPIGKNIIASMRRTFVKITAVIFFFQTARF